jgi:hypothetical protein
MVFDVVDIIARAASVADDEIVVVSLVARLDEIQYRKMRYMRQAEIAARVPIDFGPITDDSCSTCEVWEGYAGKTANNNSRQM